MKPQQRTNIFEGEWRRCKKVDLVKGFLRCQLDPEKTYALTAAYKNDVHIQFANAKSDQQLLEFVRDWGPLRIPWEAIGRSMREVALHFDVPLVDYRRSRDEMRALIQALDAFRQGVGEREALLKLMEAGEQDESEMPDMRPGTILAPGMWAATSQKLTMGDLRASIDRATQKEVLAWLELVVRRLLDVSCTLRLISKKRGGGRIEADWRLNTLESSLRWMLWYDEFTKHPLVCCAECRGVFRGKTARRRKFCDGGLCGRRVTARNAMRKKRGWTPAQIRAGWR